MVHRNRILWAVLQEAADHGYVNLSVGSISQRAKVSRRTFYEHFDTKDAALLEAIEAGVQMIRATVTSSLGAQLSRPVPLMATVEAYISAATCSAELTRTMLVEARRIGPAADAVLETHRRWFAALLRRELVAARQSEPDEESSTAIVAALDSLLWSWLDHRDKARTARQFLLLLQGPLRPVDPRDSAAELVARSR